MVEGIRAGGGLEDRIPEFIFPLGEGSRVAGNRVAVSQNSWVLSQLT